TTTVLIGNYTITETNLPTDWVLKDLTCTGPTGASVSSNPSAGQITAQVVTGATTTCTYTDTKYGHLIVNKVTNPSSDTTTPFSITASGSNTIDAPATRTITGGSSVDYRVLDGTYSIAETFPAGWDKTGDSCQNVVVPAGQTVNCQITNTERGHLIVQKVTNPANDPTVFTINASGSGSITGGGAGSISSST